MDTTQVGSAVFGIIIGYISWYAIFQNENSISMKTVGTFIGVVGGAGITTLFPDKATLFGNYCIGLGGGFFFPPIFTRIERIYEQFQTKRQQERKSSEKELDYIIENWDEIEKVVKEKLKRSLTFIDIDKLQELPMSYIGKKFILMEYARRHIEEGVSFEETSFGPWLRKI